MPTFASVVCECFVDELGPLLKEGTEAEMLGVVGLNAVVRDARSGVKLSAGVDVHEGGAFCHVEDVRHPEFLQTHRVLSYKPAGHTERRIDDSLCGDATPPVM